MINNIQIKSFVQLLSAIIEDNKNWKHTGFAKPWFRGHTKTLYELLPAILRNGDKKYEVEITTKFRFVAPGFSSTPETNRIDQWLFFMQYHRTPTRLLD